jgi:hypothetical protein
VKCEYLNPAILTWAREEAGYSLNDVQQKHKKIDDWESGEDYPTYSQINAVGKSWIFDYALALCKEMLGYIRGKYGTIPIPGREVTLNQADLLTAATAEKLALIERLRVYLDETSKKSLLERRAQESDFRKQEINNVPMVIYIG